MLKSKSKEEERPRATSISPQSPASAATVSPTGIGVSDGRQAQDSARASSPEADSKFSSFPSSFAGLPSESAPQSSAPGLDFESAVLMRMRQTERERLEREIREQEASET